MSALLKELTIRKGANLSRLSQAKDVAGAGVDLTNLTITAEIRKLTGELIIALTTEKLDQTTYPGQYYLKLTAAQTAALDVGPGEFDVEFLDGTTVYATDKVPVRIKERATNRV